MKGVVWPIQVKPWYGYGWAYNGSHEFFSIVHYLIVLHQNFNCDFPG